MCRRAEESQEDCRAFDQDEQVRLGLLDGKSKRVIIMSRLQCKFPGQGEHFLSHSCIPRRASSERFTTFYQLFLYSSQTLQISKYRQQNSCGRAADTSVSSAPSLSDEHRSSRPGK